MKKNDEIYSVWHKYRMKKMLMMMKLCIVLTFGLFLNLSATAFSQHKINMQLGKTGYKQVFAEITKQTGLTFIYSDSGLEEGMQVVANFKNEDLEEVLKTVLKGKKLTYLLKDEFIVIMPVKQQKKHRIQGKVSDEKGNPLPGVSVVVKGTNIGVATDADGNYSLEFESNDVVLVFSFIGMMSQEIKYTGQSSLHVVLKEDTEQVEEVVVTGYQTLSKERATGAFEKMDNTQIDKPSSSLADRLVGNILGFSKRQGGAYDDGGFEIRGRTSLSNSDPLIVVDGFAVEGGFSSINPNDVESVTVLKDAASASIWGARSANGVIVITSKKARKGDVKVNVSSWVKFQPVFDLDYANPLASSADVVAYEKLGFESGFFGTSTTPIPDDFRAVTESYTEGGYYSKATIALNEHRLGYLNDNELATELNRLSNLNNTRQIKDHLLQKAFTQQHNISISGGGENSSNILSLMFERGRDNFVGNNNKKYQVDYRTTMNIASWLDFSFSGMFQYDDRNLNGIGLETIQEMSPYDMLLNADGSYADMQKDFYMPLIQRNITDTGAEFPYANWSYNPLQEINTREIASREINSRFQANFTIKILQDLNYDIKLQYENYSTETESLFNEDNYETRYQVNTGAAWTIGDPSSVQPNFPAGHMLDRGKTGIESLSLRHVLSFNKSFGDHAFVAIAGSEILDRTTQTTVFGRKFGYDPNSLTFASWPNGAGDPYNLQKDFLGNPFWTGGVYREDRLSHLKDRFFSLFGNISYTYKDKYTLSASARTDASNLIADDPALRYSPFWSIGGSWQLSKENFMLDKDNIDRLTLRITYGVNGNVDRSTSTVPLISYWGDNFRAGAPQGIISSYGNPALSWEQTKAFNLGVDYSLWGEKLTGKIDFYSKKGEDLITKISIPAVYGEDSQSINAAKMSNTGLELQLGTRLAIKNKNIVWRGNLNVAYNKNKITKLYKDDATLNYRFYGPTSGWEHVQGHSAYTLWGLKYGGIDENNKPFVVSRDGTEKQYINTYHPTGFNNKNFATDEGQYHPPLTAGFINSFKIYDFDLSFVITGYFGHVFTRKGFNYDAMKYAKANINEFYSEVVHGNPNKILPIPENDPYYFYYQSFAKVMDYMTISANNIRFEEINLSYNMPKRWLKELGLSHASVFAQVNNVGVIVFNEFDQDPVFPKGTAKPLASYTFGCKFNF